MNYKIHLKYSPINELLLSFLLYKRQMNLKYLDVGKDWPDKIREKINPTIMEEMDQTDDLRFFDMLDILFEGIEDLDIPEGLQRISAMKIGEIYERISPFISDHKIIPNDLEQKRDQAVRFLNSWYEDYFSEIEDKILPPLKEGYELAKRYMECNDAVDTLDELTGGTHIDCDDFTDVFLIPIYHFRPLTTGNSFKNRLYFLFPVNRDVSEEITAIGKALSDEKRLLILRLLKNNKMSFTEIAKKIGGSKGNIHHHMAILKSAKLIHSHYMDGDCSILYSARVKPLRLLEEKFIRSVNELGNKNI